MISLTGQRTATIEWVTLKLEAAMQHSVPVQNQVTVLFLIADGYQETVCVEDERVQSPSFADWELTDGD